MKKVLIGCAVFIILAVGIYFLVLKPSSSPTDNPPAAVEQSADSVKAWAPSGDHTYMLLNNVKFRFTDDIFIGVHRMLAITEPLKPYKYVDMNDAKSFSLKIISGQCSIEPSVRENLFNKNVLNYEGSPLKDLKMEVVEVDVNGQKTAMLKINGKMKLVAWFPFEMLGTVGVDSETNSMTIDAYKIKSVGFPFIKNLLDMSGMKLSTLLSIEPGRGLSIKNNTMYVDVLNITPPPRLAGQLLDAKVNPKTNCMDLTLGEQKPREVQYSLLVPEAKNYIYIFNGALIFGKLLSSNGKLQLIDTKPADDMDFYLKKYLLQLSKSEIRMTADAAMIVYIPDYQSMI